MGFLPIQLTTKHSAEFSVLCSMFSLVIYLISLYVSIPTPHFPLGTHTFVLYVCVSISALQRGLTLLFELCSETAI